MIKLMQNELLKLHAKKSMYILLGVLAVLEIAAAIIIKTWAPADMQFEGFLVFADEIMAMVITFATIFGITLASRTITDEFQKGTIKQLLIRPRKRVTVLFSKYVIVIVAVLLICLISIPIVMLIGLVFFGSGAGEITFTVMIKHVLYKILPMLFYATVAFFLANIFRKSVLPLVITLFLFFLEGLIQIVFFQFAKGIAKYVVTFHLNLSVYDSDKLISGGAKSPFTEFNFTTSLLLVIAYFAVLLVASSALFQKRDVL
ncbi:ABC transporter permease [Bacillus sp. DX1.1]|uniref:ABC transporter permease n=1 Tax=unclassified Bacillus (in: firmicutes) TaxID=185979 RepID=UPI002570C5B9|nr:MULTISPECIES: ABC transporter permease [unclassified Bacillus (in: firmicutes)]MDM5153987.1 ABC transporter permease [Bacillus sp. DX1.1]WJE82918.1 ABC transporter permease [Bacillus sp. DX3.1]